jgi:hypothetical protein
VVTETPTETATPTETVDATETPSSTVVAPETTPTETFGETPTETIDVPAQARSVAGDVPVEAMPNSGHGPQHNNDSTILFLTIAGVFAAAGITTLLLRKSK